MLTMDVFTQDAFTAVSMTQAVDTMGFTPSYLRSLPGLFIPAPVRTTDIFIETRGNAPALIQTDQRGAPPKRRGAEQRAVRSYKALRLAESSRVNASELQNIRAFGSETELQALMTEIARREMLLGIDVDLTEENLLLGMVQGTVVDADGTTTLFDWATEFGQSIPAELDMDLDNASPASGVVRTKCNQITRSIKAALKGLGGTTVQIRAICGDAYWDNLTAHSEVRQTYLNTIAASELRAGNAWEEFSYGGIVWSNYRGSDDSKVAVNTDKAKAFPTGAGIFQMAYAPGERFEFVNTMGRPRYAGMVLDKDRNSWADAELYAYPLPVCVQPSALYPLKRT